MPKIISTPTQIEAAGTGNKIIQEFFGKVTSADSNISIAKMQSPEGWSEPGQTPEFDEYTLVLKGCMHVETKNGLKIIKAGQAIHTFAGEWIRYSTPEKEGAEYIAICLPAFTPDTVHRDK
ncbi:MAG: cupin [Planctomycetes bacterium]|nr:cupin [Planctomycetota bacterium]NBY03529.1 cupin [Planctomycetota bacterium]